MDWLSKRKFVIVCHEKVVRIPLEGDEILRVHGERTQGVVKTLMNTKEPSVVCRRGSHGVHLKLVRVGITEEGEVVTYLRFIANFSKIVKPYTSLTERNQNKYEYEIRYHPGKANVVIEALRRKERVKPRRVRAMAMTIQYGVRGMILAAQSEAFKQENGMMRTVVMDEAHASRYLVHPGADKTYYNLGDMYW
ncbi:hypothetical protein Tco_0411720 [Tanacetum coccineum]